MIQRQVFSICRTLPGHGRLRMNSSVSGLRIFGSTASSWAARARKWRARAGISSRRSASRGMWMRITFRRWNKSSRNLPACTSDSRFWWVAAMMRTSTLTGTWPPTR
ncbi:hypothetical protein D3C81_1944900 [compost metagenome]